MGNFDWVDEQEKRIKDERSKDYFNIEEGDNKFVLLSHCAPLAQVFEGGKYRIAQEGDRNTSIKGICWVLQDGLIKSAKLPYTVVKSIRAYQQNPDWEFVLPFPHQFTLHAEGAGEKEVKYSLTVSPKRVDIPSEVLAELAKKPTPEELIEKLKGKVSQGKSESPKAVDYPKDDINPDDIPF